MPLDKQRLERANSLISVVDDEAIRTGVFVDLIGELSMLFAVGKPKGEVDPDLSVGEVLHPVQYIKTDLLNIETLFERLHWQHQLWVSDQLPDGKWLRYATADVDMVHVEARSLFDYIAQVLRSISEKPGQVPDKSFEKLRNWAAKDKTNRERLGTDISTLFSNCDWFAGLREVRDDVVHRGGDTLVFLDKPALCFQTYQKHKKKVLLPEVMANKNVVDFELYGGMTYGYLLAFLEEVAETVYRRLNVTRRPGSCQQRSPGAMIGKQWLEKLLGKI